MADRGCTDVCCLVVLLVFSTGLAALAWEGEQRGDLRRLTHGFDFRGRLCGVDNTTKVDAKDADFLHWCHRDGKVAWDSPICRPKCPESGDKLMCPEEEATKEEKEEKQRDGSVIVTTMARRKIVPKDAIASRQFGLTGSVKICFPEEFGPQALVGLLSLGSDESGGLTGRVLEACGHVAALWNAPRLLAFLAVSAGFSGLAWVLWLRMFARTFAHAQFALTILGLISMGSVLLAAPYIGHGELGEYAPAVDALMAKANQGATQAASAVSWYSTGSEASGQAAALAAKTAGVDIVSRALATVKQSGAPIAVLGSWGRYAQIGLGVVLLVLGIAVFAWYRFARHKLAVAADCVRESCLVMFSMPTLVLLPVIQLLLSVVVTVLACTGLVLSLSTAEVRSSSAHVLGQTVNGIHRSVDWTGELAGAVACWVFAIFWFQELAGAICHFVVSYTSARWYLDGATALLPILKGSAVGVFYHLGSLALAAFVMALLRIFRWIVTILHWAANNEKANRCVRCCLVCLDCCLAAAQAIAERLSDSAFTHVAITSESFFTSSMAAASLLSSNLELLVMSSWVLRPFMFLGSIFYSAGVGLLTRAVLVHGPKDAFARWASNGILQGVASEWVALASPAAAAAVTAIMSFVVVRGFAVVINRVSDAVLYLFLWDKQDGVVDAESAPESFREFLKTSLQTHPKAE